MTDLCNEQYSIFVQIIGGAWPPRAPPIPTAMGTQKNRLNDTALLSTQNNVFKLRDK